MKFVKNWAYLVAAAVAFGGIAALHSATHRAAPPTPESQIVCAADSADLALRDRIAAKQAVVEDLIARRTSLFEAAAAFRAARRPGAGGRDPHRPTPGRVRGRGLLPLRH